MTTGAHPTSHPTWPLVILIDQSPKAASLFHLMSPVSTRPSGRKKRKRTSRRIDPLAERRVYFDFAHLIGIGGRAYTWCTHVCMRISVPPLVHPSLIFLAHCSREGSAAVSSARCGSYSHASSPTKVVPHHKHHRAKTFFNGLIAHSRKPGSQSARWSRAVSKSHIHVFGHASCRAFCIPTRGGGKDHKRTRTRVARCRGCRVVLPSHIAPMTAEVHADESTRGPSLRFSFRLGRGIG